MAPTASTDGIRFYTTVNRNIEDERGAAIRTGKIYGDFLTFWMKMETSAETAEKQI